MRQVQTKDGDRVRKRHLPTKVPHRRKNALVRLINLWHGAEDERPDVQLHRALVGTKGARLAVLDAAERRGLARLAAADEDGLDAARDGAAAAVEGGGEVDELRGGG